MTKPRYSREFLASLQAEGFTAQEAADFLGYERDAMNKAARRLGLPLWKYPKRVGNGGGGRPKLDRELIKILDAEGKTAQQIAEALSTPDRRIDKRTIGRIRGELDIRHEFNNTPYPQEFKDRVLAMLEDGAPYAEVARTFDVKVDTIRRWFPGKGWDISRGPEARRLKNALERLDNPTVPKL